jgi:methyltransferase-like protein
MKKLLTLGLPVLVIIVGAVYWCAHLAIDEQPQTMTALEKTGDECDFISEKAAMHLPETLPFQKLEKAARKARVLNNCMQDRAYIENPAWVKYAQPIAQKIAETQHTSYDEAYEELRRKTMYVFKASQGTPAYWVTSQTPS